MTNPRVRKVNVGEEFVHLLYGVLVDLPYRGVLPSELQFLTLKATSSRLPRMHAGGL
jgi:hypothetical protein